MGADVGEKIKEEEFVRLGRHGLSEMEMERPLETMFSAGILKVWQTRQALSFNKALGEGRGHSYAIPLWQELTGLFPEAELGMNPNTRAEKVAGLIEKVERLLRYELRAFEKRRAAASAAKNGDKSVPATETGIATDAENESRWARPTAAWDPVRAICFELGISQRKLSSYCKEISGLSITQLVDVIRAEELRKRLKKELREFVRGLTGALGDKSVPATSDGDISGMDRRRAADEIYALLKETRRGPRFHRTTWAMGLGFSSYPRLFQSCVLCHGLTPHQMEIELIEEILKEGSVGQQAEGGNDNTCVLGQKVEAEEAVVEEGRRAG